MLKIDPDLLKKLHKSVPRYTSYPTAPTWDDHFPEAAYRALLEKTSEPLSLYIHIPFCKTMCLFCGCSVVLNRKPENEEKYVAYLIREIEIVAKCLKKKKRVNQLHFGGGTPTKLSSSLLSEIMRVLNRSFYVDFSGEISIEVDPRTVLEDEGAKLKNLFDLGFNRISFGVQDTDSKVQEAIKRRQSEFMTCTTFSLARAIGFSKINIDLIYGLPHQTKISFKKTIQTICNLRPNRIAFFSYAKIPWLKPHQKAIPDELLPSMEEKFSIYSDARESLITEGYCAIGMDHFALNDDDLAQSYHQKTLYRNFQGYSVRMADEMIGFGMTAIGFVQDTYIQNEKTLEEYYTALDRDQLPCHRGKALSPDDIVRRWVILKLMCHFHIDKHAFFEAFRIPFDTYFSKEKKLIQGLEKDGLIHNKLTSLNVTPIGELFIRNIALAFDAYTRSSDQPLHSQSI